MTVYATQDDSLCLVSKLTSSVLTVVHGIPLTIFQSLSGVRRTNAALEAIASHISRHNIIENRTSDSTRRTNILLWLLPARTEESEDFIPAPTHLDVRHLAEIAVAVTLRDAQPHVGNSLFRVSNADTFTDIERSYLLSSFHRRISSFGQPIDGQPETNITSNVLRNVGKQLTLSILADVEYYIQNASSEVNMN